MQEYIEALSYFTFITTGKLIGWETICEIFSFKIGVSKIEDSEEPDRETKLLLPLSDFILGIQDMTGEVMRYVFLIITQFSFEF